MNNIQYIIRRFDTSEHHQIPNKIVGFEIVNQTSGQSAYHETLLKRNDVMGKTSEECIDLAFNQLSSSISKSVSYLSSNESSVLGAYYIPPEQSTITNTVDSDSTESSDVD
jgi:hypothetical protein